MPMLANAHIASLGYLWFKHHIFPETQALVSKEVREREGRKKQWIGDRREVRRSEVGKEN